MLKRVELFPWKDSKTTGASDKNGQESHCFEGHEKITNDFEIQPLCGKIIRQPKHTFPGYDFCACHHGMIGF